MQMLFDGGKKKERWRRAWARWSDLYSSWVSVPRRGFGSVGASRSRRAMAFSRLARAIEVGRGSTEWRLGRKPRLCYVTEATSLRTAGTIARATGRATAKEIAQDLAQSWIRASAKPVRMNVSTRDMAADIKRAMSAMKRKLPWRLVSFIV